MTSVGFEPTIPASKRPQTRLKADSHIACRAHAAKGLECVSHLVYTVRPCLIHTCHAAPMPVSDHAFHLKGTAQHGMGAAWKVESDMAALCKSNAKYTF